MGLPWDPKTYRFKGSSLQLRGHNLLFCRAWGHRRVIIQGSPFNGFFVSFSFQGFLEGFYRGLGFIGSIPILSRDVETKVQGSLGIPFKLRVLQGSIVGFPFTGSFKGLELRV